MSSVEKISDLLARKAELAFGGGKDKMEKHAKDGSLGARARINALLDEDSFVEIGAFVSARNECTASDGVVTGYGTIDSRLVYVFSQDVTVLDGAIGEMYADKVQKVIDMASKMGAPVIGMFDSNGVRLKEGALAQKAMGKILSAFSCVSGVVPCISMVLGNCAGGSAIAAAMSDFVIINEKNGKMFVNGPDVIEATEGKVPPLDAKGNINESGNAHFVGADDISCIEIAKILLSYLPSNNLSDSFEYETGDDLNRACEILDNTDEISDVRVIVSEIADDKAYFEVQKDYASEISAGFIRINGSSVGVVASGGEELSGRAIQKAARFVRFCDCYNIPVLTITDVDGFKVSSAEEIWGLARKSAELMYAFCEATVAKVNLIVKKAYGTTAVMFNSKDAGADIVLAYPTACMAPLNPQAGIRMLMDDKLKAGVSPQNAENEYKETEASIYKAASLGCIDDIIVPSETRARITAAFEMLKSKRAAAPSRKHDNMPL